MSQKTVAYIRVSTEKQTEGTGPEQQHTAIAAWAAMNRIIIDEWVTEAETGTTAERPIIQQLLQQSADGELARIVLDRTDRLGRLARVSIALRDQFMANHTEVVFAKEQIDGSDMGSLVFTMMSGVAEYQRKEWLRRMQQCKDAAVRKRGTFRGGQVPLGYIATSNGRLAIDPEFAPAIRMVFDLKEAGHTLTSIAHSLKLGGYTTKSGRAFDPKQISNILKREDIYRGQNVFGHTVTDAGIQPMHPAILS